MAPTTKAQLAHAMRQGKYYNRHAGYKHVWVTWARGAQYVWGALTKLFIGFRNKLWLNWLWEQPHTSKGSVEPEQNRYGQEEWWTAAPEFKSWCSCQCFSHRRVPKENPNAALMTLYRPIHPGQWLIMTNTSISWSSGHTATGFHPRRLMVCWCHVQSRNTTSSWLTIVKVKSKCIR